MIHYMFGNKLYRINENKVHFFCTWNQMWLSTEVSAKTLKDKGTVLL